MNRRTLSVLYVDDDPSTRFLLQQLAAEHSVAGSESAIEWLEASGVEEAITQYRTARPDAVLLDNRLGAEEGVDLVPRIRQVWNCPIWILTGLSTPELRDRSARNGAAGVIDKGEIAENPGRLRELLRLMP